MHLILHKLNGVEVLSLTLSHSLFLCVSLWIANVKVSWRRSLFTTMKPFPCDDSVSSDNEFISKPLIVKQRIEWGMLYKDALVW